MPDSVGKEDGQFGWKGDERREEQSELSFPLQIMNSCKNRKIW